MSTRKLTENYWDCVERVIHVSSLDWSYCFNSASRLDLKNKSSKIICSAVRTGQTDWIRTHVVFCSLVNRLDVTLHLEDLKEQDHHFVSNTKTFTQSFPVCKQLTYTLTVSDSFLPSWSQPQQVQVLGFWQRGGRQAASQLPAEAAVDGKSQTQSEDRSRSWPHQTDIKNILFTCDSKNKVKGFTEKLRKFPANVCFTSHLPETCPARGQETERAWRENTKK